MSGQDDERRREQASLLLAADLGIARSGDIAAACRVAAEATSRLLGAHAELVITRRGAPLTDARHALSDDERPFAHDVSASAHAGSTHLVAELRAHRDAPFDDADRGLTEHLVQMALGTVDTLVQLTDAKAAIRERQELVTMVSHDMRTPLQSVALGIDSISMTLAGTEIAGTMAPRLERIQRAVGTITRLLGDLLDVSRAQDGALSVRMRACDGALLVRELAEQHVPSIIARGMTLETMASSVGRLVCDPTRLAQALSNLLVNATKYATEGPIVLRAARRGDVVRFEVEDQGPGIAAEVQARFFDRLYQPADAHTERTGLGLGLYIARGIALAHGGAIGVESEVGRGSTFWLEIPVRDTGSYPAMK